MSADLNRVERKALSDNLRLEYGNDSFSQRTTDGIFALAWQEGHESGVDEVKDLYWALVSVANSAFEDARQVAIKNANHRAGEFGGW